MTVTSRISKGTMPTVLWVAAALGSYALANAATLRAELNYHGFQGVMLALYLFVYALSGITLAVLLASANIYFKVVAGTLILAIVTTNQLVVDLLNLRVLNIETADWLFSETRMAPAAISEFFGPVMRHLANCTALLLPFTCVVVLGRGRLRQHSLNPVPLAIGALAAYGLSGVILYHYFKPFMPVESNLVFWAADLALRPSPDISRVDLAPTHQSEATKIILLVDETVTYAEFGAQLRQDWAKWHNSVDFGEAASLGNCSAASNSILRWGFRAERMLAGDDPRLAPTIWSYARETGYGTYLIDGQQNGSFQNFMRKKEAALIDHYMGVERGVDTDRSVADLLHALLLKPGKMFIYVNKRGNHWPYTDNYPLTQLPDARSLEHQYATSVKYSNQAFVDRMLQGVSLGNVLIIYTSDHGERFDGVGTPHCNVIPAWQEISVPLLLVTGSEALAQQAEAAAIVLKDRVGHEQIFATLLYAMGYDLQASENIYGSSLLSDRIPQRYFHVFPSPIASKGGKPAVETFSHFPYRGS